ncbi:hypothetical protein D3C78_1828950 [compost metagenome]
MEARRHGGGKYGFADARSAVFADVACHFAPAHGKAHQRGVVEVQVVEQNVQVLRQGVVVIAFPWLG